MPTIRKSLNFAISKNIGKIMLDSVLESIMSLT